MLLLLHTGTTDGGEGMLPHIEEQLAALGIVSPLTEHQLVALDALTHSEGPDQVKHCASLCLTVPDCARLCLTVPLTVPDCA